MKRNGFLDLPKAGRAIMVILAHITVLLAVLVLVLFVIDHINDAMQFMSSRLSMWIIAVLAFTAFESAMLSLILHDVRAFRVVITAHVCLLAAIVLLLFVLELINGTPGPMSSRIARWIVAVLAVFALITAITNIVALWDNPDKYIRGYGNGYDD